MNKEQKSRVQLLVDALRSGKYAQIANSLRTEEGYCCLGVACDIAVQHGVTEWSGGSESEGEYRAGDEDGTLPDVVADWYGFDSDNPRLKGQIATYLNDKAGKTFEEIADLFEEEYLK